MEFLQPGTLYLVSILIVPGLLSQSVFNYLIERGKTHTLDIYQGLIHSFYIYMFIYPIALLFLKSSGNIGTWLNTPAGPIITALLLVVVSIGWGYLRARLYQDEDLDKKFTKLRATEPPNLYAAILDPQYTGNENENDQIWITATLKDMLVSGSLERYSLATSPREIELKNVIYFPNDDTENIELPVDVSVIIKVNDIQIIEIRHINV